MKLADSVLMRIVQVVQEGILVGCDVVDIMRQIDVVIDPDNTNQLVLTSEYVNMVKQQHQKMLDTVEVLRQEQVRATATGQEQN